MRVCIVGGGLTGALAASMLRSKLPALHIEMWDKAARFGGRMCTKRKPSEPRNCSVDVGAQYISCTPDYYAQHKSYYEELLTQGVLQPMTCGVTGDRHPSNTRHFVAPLGMSSVVQHYVDKAAVCSKFGAEVRTVKCEGLVAAAGRKRWQVATAGAQEEVFDAVLLTLPVPQMLKLEGDAVPAMDSVAGLRKELEAVRYSSRFCLGLFYPPDAHEKIILPGGVGAMYLDNPSSPFCYAAVDTRRRGLLEGADVGVSAMLHTSRSFGEARVEETKEALLGELLESFHDLLPDWPQPLDAFCHKWRYSQVVTGVPSERGGSVGLGGGSLVLSGDAFTHSNVDGCISAASSAAKTLLCYLEQLEG